MFGFAEKGSSPYVANKKRVAVATLSSLEDHQGLERLCLSFAAQTPIVFGFAERGSSPGKLF